jgi:diguanylate cyclase
LDGKIAARPVLNSDIVRMRACMSLAATEQDAPDQAAPRATAKIRKGTPDRTFDRTIPYALTAVQQMSALRVPADPPSFHLWYTYATGVFPGLNQTINEMLARPGELSIDDLDRVYDIYLSSTSIGERVERIGTVINDEVSQVIAMLDAAIGTGADYVENLSDVNKRLVDARDRDSLSEIVETLVRSTREFAQQNQLLRSSLSSSKEDINGLQTKLAVICQESLTDPLTALGNRKQFDQALDSAIKQSKDDQRPLSLLMCDVDHFKKFNDTFGHVTGDQVLRLIAVVMKQGVREQDTPARYGGEEFAVILPDTELSQAGVVAENLRRMIVDKKVVKRSTGEDLGKVTISIGIAQFRRGDDPHTLIERADSCLYAAKRAGRNCVVPELDIHR